MNRCKPLTLKKRYRLRDGRPVICLECQVPRATVNDGFNWKAWFIGANGRREFNWYNAYGQWASFAQTSVDLIEIA